MVCFQIVEEAKTQANKYGDTRLAWIKLSRKFDPTTGYFKKILRNKISKCKLDDVTRNPEEWITQLELLRGDLRKLDVKIDGSEMMTHILSNLPEEYQNIVEILEYGLDDDSNTLNIKRIRDKLSVKFDRMNEQ